MLMAGTAGAVGSFVGTPADVALVRMTTDGRLPIGNDKFLNKIISALIFIDIRENISFTRELFNFLFFNAQIKSKLFSSLFF